MQNSVLVRYDQFLFHEGNIVIFFILFYCSFTWTWHCCILTWKIFPSKSGIYRTHLSRRIPYFGRGFTIIVLYLLRQRTSQPVTYTQSHNTHLHEVHFMSIISSPLTLKHFILRHNARARYVVTCTLLHMSVAAAAQAPVVSALQLTPDILAAH